MREYLPQTVSTSLSSLNLVLETSHSIPEIPELLNETVLFGGKRLRPALCFLVGEMLGVPQTTMAPFARAAEFTHCASLAHDDVLDNATLRRNHPTLNSRTSNARAVLAGDLLLARVMVELSDRGNIDIIRDLAMTVEDLVNGEWLQLQARGSVDVTFQHLTEVSRRKTASLMGWSCRVAARLSPKTSAPLLQACSEFGKSLGVAFQMVDDVIDFEPTSEKDFAKDYKEGLVNFVVAEMLKQSPELQKPLAENLGRGADAKFVWSNEQLSQAKENVRSEAAKYLLEASRNLEIMADAMGDSQGAQECHDSLNQLLLFLGARSL